MRKILLLALGSIFVSLNPAFADDPNGPCNGEYTNWYPGYITGLGIYNWDDGRGILQITFKPDPYYDLYTKGTEYIYTEPSQNNMTTDIGKAYFAVAMQAYSTGAHVNIYCSGSDGAKIFKDILILSN